MIPVDVSSPIGVFWATFSFPSRHCCCKEFRLTFRGIFKKIAKTEDGSLEITLGNGETLTLEVFNSLNLKLKSDAVTIVSDTSKPLKIEYEVTGESAENAIVAIAQAVNVKATLDKETRTLTVTFENGFDEGHVIITAYDLNHLVIRPLLFKKN